MSPARNSFQLTGSLLVAYWCLLQWHKPLVAGEETKVRSSRDKMMKKPRIAVIDDDPVILKLMNMGFFA